MMEGLNRMWKTIPVWFVILLLIVGAIAAAGVWMLRIESPGTYDEPFTVEYKDELDENEWEKVNEFPNQVETDPVDLTYGTFHNYVRLTSERRRPVLLNATFLAKTGGDLQPEDVGFVLLEGIVEPERIQWDSTERLSVQGPNDNRTAEIDWRYTQENITLEKGEPQEYTVIAVLSNNAPLDTGANDLLINWQFRRTEPTPSPEEVDIPTPLDRIYNFTPIILVVSIIITALIGYAMYKQMWREE